MNRFEQNNSLIRQDSAGIQSYMVNVYGWMTVAILLTSFVAFYTVHNSNIIAHVMMNKWILVGLIACEFSLVFGLTFFLQRLTGEIATAMLMLYSVLTGLTTSLSLIAYTGASIAGVFLTVSIMFGSLSIYGYSTKKSLSGLGNFLFMSVIGLTIVSLVNMWMKSSFLNLLFSYIGILVFSGLTAYDTQKLKEIGNRIDGRDKENMRKYAILGALTLYLDFINLFLMTIQVVGNRRQ
ncbi:hypothetical protein AOQ88_02320 [Candidatus Riesia sp. GBBU]|nr:hypothetical protein AOQ88_02130 [Candidatus Riesia sp. GBBU]ARC55055.1 hypothetical protein AOQ88_02320 [Candidatus Riesia sp. GBBU]